MNLPAKKLSSRLPRTFPVGARYVVEGRPGRDGDMQVSSRYVILPDGRRIDVGLDQGPVGREIRPRRNRPRRARKNYLGR
jgi:hypothetical protein